MPSSDNRLATAIWALVAAVAMSLAFDIFAYFNSVDQWVSAVEELNAEQALPPVSADPLDISSVCPPCDFYSLPLAEQLESATAIVIAKNIAPIDDDRFAPVVTEVLKKPDGAYRQFDENSILVFYEFSAEMVAESVEGLVVLYAGDPPREMRALRFFDDHLADAPHLTLDDIREIAAR